jgi:phage terminase large subunit GpA-like protein
MLEERFPRAGGGIEVPVRMMCIDSGYNTTHVYDFCRRFGADRVVPVKGQDNLGMAVAAPKTVDVTRSGKRIGRVRLWNVGSSFLKSELYSWLRLEKEAGTPPPCYCHFPQYSENYFMGLTAEEHVKKVVRGYPRYEWVKKYERNEPLDCRVYARAAAAIVGLDRLRPESLAAIGGHRYMRKPAPQLEFQTASTLSAAVASTTVQRPRRRDSFWN